MKLKLLLFSNRHFHFVFKLQKKNLSYEIEGTNLFVTCKFLYSQYRKKEEKTEGLEDLFPFRIIFGKSVFVRTISTVY